MKESVWNAKGAIAEAIVPILSEYADGVRSGDMQCLPTWVLEDGEELSDRELTSRWLAILDAMIFAFDSERSDVNLSIEQKELRQKIGLEYFSKYYGHLWD